MPHPARTTLILAVTLAFSACTETPDPPPPADANDPAPRPAAAATDPGTTDPNGSAPDPATAALLRDLNRPEHLDRFRDACARLPDHWNPHTEAAAIALIQRPRYPRPLVSMFLDRTLVPEPDPQRRQHLFERFGASRGDRYRVAAIVELATFAIAYPTLEDHQRALAHLRYPLDADRTLGERFDLTRGSPGYQQLLDSLPPVIEQYTLAELIHALPDDPGEPTRAALAELLHAITGITYDLYDPANRQMATGTDYLVIAIAPHLIGTAHDDRIRDYAESRLHAAEHHGHDLRQLLKQLPTPR